MTLDDIAPPKYASHGFILGLWDSNAPTAVLVAWNVDEFDEGARTVQPLVLGEVVNLKRARTVLMDHSRTEEDQEPTYFPARN